jgi:hypothetical protein
MPPLLGGGAERSRTIGRLRSSGSRLLERLLNLLFVLSFPLCPLLPEGADSVRGAGCPKR